MKSQILSIFIFIAFSVKAQSPETVTAKVFYKLTHAYDTTNSQKTNIEDFYLELAKSSWTYKSYTKFLRDSAVLADSKKAGHFVPPVGQKKGTTEEIYILPNQKILFFRPNTLVGNYLLSQDLPVFKWKLENERKKIAGFSCQKASSIYQGRNYTVWFTNELPFAAGPWKLHGLPGLILEAYDRTGRIKFEFTGFVPVKDGKILASGERTNTRIGWKDFKKIVGSYENDPKGFYERQLNATITTSAPFPKTMKYNGHINFPFAENEIYK